MVAGEASLSDVLCFDPSDAEDGWFNDYQVGSCFTRDELAVRAGRYSDNTAAHILVRYLGGPDALNTYAKSIGMSSSALWNPNTTTTDDLIVAWLNEVLGRLGGEGSAELVVSGADPHGERGGHTRWDSVRRPFHVGGG